MRPDPVLARGWTGRRRLLLVERPVAAALWCRWFAVFGLLLAAIAVLASRAGLVQPPGALAVLGAALCCAGASLPLALLAAAVIWRTGRPGLGAALGGLTLAVLLAAYPAYLAREAAGLPVGGDAMTDPDDPLPFSRTPRALAVRHGAAHDPAPAAERKREAEADPDLRPLTLDVPAAEAEQDALKLVKARRWAVVEAQQPAGRPATGRVEAVARTAVMGFPDDIAIRFAATGANQTRVDMRSASRFGRRDLGANAARIKAFLSDLEDATDEN